MTPQGAGPADDDQPGAARPPELSVVIPVYDEEGNVEPLWTELTAALRELGREYEVIFVDDGSRDRTVERLRSICRRDPRVQVLCFPRNCGQTAAIQAGFDRAAGGIIVTLDGDRQNDPADIGALLERMDEGYDLVAGWRRRRRDQVLLRRLPSWAANWLLRRLVGCPIHDTGCTLRAYRRAIIEKARLYADMHRYLIPVLSLSGGRMAEVVVNHRPRLEGRSKYGLTRVWQVALDLVALKMLLRFSSHPVVWFVILALPFTLLALGAAGAGLFLWATEAQESLPIVAFSTMLLALFAAGQLLLFGMVAELVVSLGDYRETDPLVFQVETA